ALAAVALMAGRKRLGTTASTALAAVFILGMLALDFTGGRGISAVDGADRLEAWANGLEMFKSAPLFGIGFNGFTDLYEITAHNSFVLCLAELGLLGSTLWMALLVTTTAGLNRVVLIAQLHDNNVPGSGTCHSDDCASTRRPQTARSRPLDILHPNCRGTD